MKDILKKFMDNTSMIANKEAKTKVLENNSKKSKNKKSGLKKENKVLKETLGNALLEIDRLGKFQKSQTSRTLAQSTAEDTILMLTSTLREKGILDFNNKKLASLNSKKLQNARSGQVDALQAELIAQVSKMRRKDKEIEALKEKLSISELDLNEAGSLVKTLQNENTQLNKAMDKAQKMFKKEMETLIKKI